MFEKEIFENIKNSFEIEVYFGEAPANTGTPYIVQYSLDTDGTREVLCNTDNFTDGRAFIQWNIYHFEPTNAFYLKTELMKLIADLKILSSYRILINNHENSPSGTDSNTGLFTEIVARTFTYTKL